MVMETEAVVDDMKDAMTIIGRIRARLSEEEAAVVDATEDIKNRIVFNQFQQELVELLTFI